MRLAIVVSQVLCAVALGLKEPGRLYARTVVCQDLKLKDTFSPPL
jgi:hypothetical protein